MTVKLVVPYDKSNPGHRIGEQSITAPWMASLKDMPAQNFPVMVAISDGVMPVYILCPIKSDLLALKEKVLSVAKVIVDTAPTIGFTDCSPLIYYTKPGAYQTYLSETRTFVSPSKRQEAVSRHKTPSVAKDEVYPMKVCPSLRKRIFCVLDGINSDSEGELSAKFAQVVGFQKIRRRTKKKPASNHGCGKADSSSGFLKVARKTP